ncbi:MAG: DUF4433 domain-containing protein [Candidatus Berkiella sp.]
MTTPIYHITHLKNLASILQQGCLWSDYRRIQFAFSSENIGYSHIKERRMKHPVVVAEGQTLGHYVPFNFCPRSVMLYVVSRGHDNYQGGQTEILHLVSSVEMVSQHQRPYFFTDIHADLHYAQQYTDLQKLNDLNWRAIRTNSWGGDADKKSAKQAEFLVHDFLPWTTIERIIVHNEAVAEQVRATLSTVEHQPTVVVKPDWYY